MPRFQHILFPVDFSKRCQAAKPFVASMIQRFDAKLTLLHVINMPIGWYGGIDSPYPVMFDIPALLKDGRKEAPRVFRSAAGHGYHVPGRTWRSGKYDYLLQPQESG